LLSHLSSLSLSLPSLPHLSRYTHACSFFLLRQFAEFGRPMGIHHPNIQVDPENHPSHREVVFQPAKNSRCFFRWGDLMGMQSAP
jgi:hypothetical protein